MERPDTRAPSRRAVQLDVRWYTVHQVAEMLGYGLSKTKMLVATGQIRSLKDGRHRRVLPRVGRRVRRSPCR
jgi:excisionase family DNA binding protein